MPQIAQYARFAAHEGRGPEVVGLLEKAAVAAAKEPGTLVYTIHLAGDDADTVWMYELYESAQAQADHSGSDATAALRAGVADLLREPLTVARGPVHQSLGLPPA